MEPETLEWILAAEQQALSAGSARRSGQLTQHFCRVLKARALVGSSVSKFTFYNQGLFNTLNAKIVMYGKRVSPERRWWHKMANAHMCAQTHTCVNGRKQKDICLERMDWNTTLTKGNDWWFHGWLRTRYGGFIKSDHQNVKSQGISSMLCLSILDSGKGRTYIRTLCRAADPSSHHKGNCFSPACFLSPSHRHFCLWMNLLRLVVHQLCLPSIQPFLCYSEAFITV